MPARGLRGRSEPSHCFNGSGPLKTVPFRPLEPRFGAPKRLPSAESATAAHPGPVSPSARGLKVHFCARNRRSKVDWAPEKCNFTRPFRCLPWSDDPHQQWKLPVGWLCYGCGQLWINLSPSPSKSSNAAFTKSDPSSFSGTMDSKVITYWSSNNRFANC